MRDQFPGLFSLLCKTALRRIVGRCRHFSARQAGFSSGKIQNQRYLVATNFPSDEIFLTTEEVLEYLQVNLRTVYRLIKAGKIPAVRVGRQWRFRKRDIDAWLDSQRPRGDRPAAVPLDKPQGRDGRSRVLVVDDESSIRELLSEDAGPRGIRGRYGAGRPGRLERLRLGTTIC